MAESTGDLQAGRDLTAAVQKAQIASTLLHISDMLEYPAGSLTKSRA